MRYYPFFSWLLYSWQVLTYPARPRLFEGNEAIGYKNDGVSVPGPTVPTYAGKPDKKVARLEENVVSYRTAHTKLIYIRSIENLNFAI